MNNKNDNNEFTIDDNSNNMVANSTLLPVSHEEANLKYFKFKVLQKLSFNFISTNENIERNLQHVYENTANLRNEIINATSIEDMKRAFDEHYEKSLPENRNIFLGDEKLTDILTKAVNRQPDKKLPFGHPSYMDNQDINDVKFKGKMRLPLETIQNPIYERFSWDRNIAEEVEKHAKLSSYGLKDEIKPPIYFEDFKKIAQMSIDEIVEKTSAWRASDDYSTFRDKTVSTLKQYGFASYGCDADGHDIALTIPQASDFIENTGKLFEKASKALGVKPEQIGFNGQLALNTIFSEKSYGTFCVFRQSISLHDDFRYGSKLFSDITSKMSNEKYESLKMSTIVHEWAHALDSQVMLEVGIEQQKNINRNNYKQNYLPSADDHKSYNFATDAFAVLDGIPKNSPANKAIETLRDIMFRGNTDIFKNIQQGLLGEKLREEEKRQIFEFAFDLPFSKLNKQQQQNFNSNAGFQVNVFLNRVSLEPAKTLLVAFTEFAQQNNIELPHNINQKIEYLNSKMPQVFDNQNTIEFKFDRDFDLPENQQKNAHHIIKQLKENVRKIVSQNTHSQFLVNSLIADNKTNQYYYSQPCEMFARNTESHISLTETKKILGVVAVLDEDKDYRNGGVHNPDVSARHKKHFVISFQNIIQHTLGKEALRDDAIVAQNPLAYEQLVEKRNKNMKHARAIVKTSNMISSAFETFNKAKTVVEHKIHQIMDFISPSKELVQTQPINTQIQIAYSNLSKQHLVTFGNLQNIEEIYSNNKQEQKDNNQQDTLSINRDIIKSYANANINTNKGYANNPKEPELITLHVPHQNEKEPSDLNINNFDNSQNKQRKQIKL